MYVQMSQILGTPSFPSQWDPLRTPLFPAELKTVFWLMGMHPGAVVALNCLMGFCGIWALGAALKRIGFPRAAGAGIVVLSFYPAIITYEHSLLSDIGIFFFCTCMINVTLWQPQSLWRKTLAMILTFTLAYYYRANLIYLAPVAAVIHGIDIYLRNRTIPGSRHLRSAMLHTALVAAIPFVLSYPWKLTVPSGGRTSEVLLLGFVCQAVIPPEDPVMAGDPDYVQTINSSMVWGYLSIGGLGGQGQTVALKHMEALKQYSPLTLIAKYPWRYGKGVIRTVLLFFGGHPIFSETKAFLRSIIRQDDQSDTPMMGCPPYLMPLMQEHFTQKSGKSAIGNMILFLDPVFDWLIIIGSLVTAGMGIVALLKLNVELMSFSLISLAVVAMYALVLLSAERYAVPCYSIGVFNLFVTGGYFLEPRSSLSSVTITSIPDGIILKNSG